MHINSLLYSALLCGFGWEAVVASPVPDDSASASSSNSARSVDRASKTSNRLTRDPQRQAHAVVDVRARTPAAAGADAGAAPGEKNAEREAAAPLQHRQVPDTHVQHERQLPHLQYSWRRVERVPADVRLPMRIGLKQRNLDAGHSLLMAMSDPSSPQFGKHMTSDEVVALFAPPQASVDLVMEWLASAGIGGSSTSRSSRVALSANKQWVQFDATAAEAEQLLLTEFFLFEHSATGTRDIAAYDYHLPRNVQDHVDYITPGIRLRHDDGKAKQAASSLRRRRDIREAPARTPAALHRRNVHALHTKPEFIIDGDLPAALPNATNTCSRSVTPDCVQRQYNIPPATLAVPGNELGIFESLAEHYSKDDLDYYYSHVWPVVPKGTYPKDRLIDGALGASSSILDAGAEANLDFQAAIPLIYPQGTVLFQTDDERIQLNTTSETTPYAGFWNTFFDAIDGSYCNYSAFGETGDCTKAECLDPSYPDPGPKGYNGTRMCGVFKPTNVISISYGGGEADVPAYYWQRQCSEIMKLGLQGVTVVISSGDQGVASYPGDGGHQNGCGGPRGTAFYPSSQATCPYVLAVGSTVLEQASTPSTAPSTPGAANQTWGRLREVATKRFPSGGGFSNYFDAPDYQKDAVTAYLKSVKLPFSGYKTAGTNFSRIGNGRYHIGGRGYPDVSAIGDNYVVRLGGSWALIGGTSLAAPLWASMLNLINEERLVLGKSTLGFVNPILYQHPEVFYDITEGSNPGCGTPGFPAAKGWDPVTGLGAPNYPKLLDLLRDLP